MVKAITSTPPLVKIFIRNAAGNVKDIGPMPKNASDNWIKDLMTNPNSRSIAEAIKAGTVRYLVLPAKATLDNARVVFNRLG